MSITLHPGQVEAYKDLFIDKVNQYGVVCCSRGWGKSFVASVAATTAAYELMELPATVPNKLVYIIAPTYEQVTDIYFPLLNYDLGLENVCIKTSKDQGRFLFPNRVELRLLSYEAIERMRGKGPYFVVWDEVSSCTKGIDPQEAWESIIQPAISTRWSPKNAERVGAKSPGRAFMLSTPKGYNFFHTLYTRRETNSTWKSYHYTYRDSPFLDPDEIERIKQDIDPIKFASEYEASFEESGYSVFYCFNRDTHVSNEIQDFYKEEGDTPGEPVHLAIDFNVGLQCTTAFALRGSVLECIEEFKGHPDTETLAIALSTRFKGHKILAYPDPSGKANKTSAPVGRTDFSILESYGITVLSRSKAPPIVDSVQAVNRKLKNASNQVGMLFHPRCKGAIASMERTKWVDRNPDTATIDKSEGIEHFSDGIRYITEYLFPIKSHKAVTKRGFGF